MSTTRTSKGQVTIPKRARDGLGVTPGKAVDFHLEAAGRVVRVKAGDASRLASRFAALRGRAGPGMTTDEIMALTRGE